MSFSLGSSILPFINPYSLLRYVLNHIPHHRETNDGPLATVGSVGKSVLCGYPAWCRQAETTVEWNWDLPKAGTETSDGVRKARSLGQLTCETDIHTSSPWVSHIPDTPSFIVCPFFFFLSFSFFSLSFSFFSFLSLFLVPFFPSFIYLINTCWNLCPGTDISVTLLSFVFSALFFFLFLSQLFLPSVLGMLYLL